MPDKQTKDRHVLAITLLSMHNEYRGIIQSKSHAALDTDSLLKRIDPTVYEAHREATKQTPNYGASIGAVAGVPYAMTQLNQYQTFFAECALDYSGGSCPEYFVQTAVTLLVS